MTKRKISENCVKAINIIKKNGGLIRTSEAINSGIHPRNLYELRDSGELEKLSHGVYRLTEMKSASNPDFIIIGTRVPDAIICLVSSLAYHELTTQIPHEISISIPKDNKAPKIDYPPIKVHKFSFESYKAGIEDYIIDGVKIKIYNPEKTIVDCFKFRNKIGMDIVLEALKLYKKRMKFNHKKILEYAEICRVKKIIIPYIEANL